MQDETRRLSVCAGVDWVEVERYRRWVADLGDGRQLQVREVSSMFGEWEATLIEAGQPVALPGRFMGALRWVEPRRADAMSAARHAASELGWVPSEADEREQARQAASSYAWEDLAGGLMLRTPHGVADVEIDGDFWRIARQDGRVIAAGRSGSEIERMAQAEVAMLRAGLL